MRCSVLQAKDDVIQCNDKWFRQQHLRKIHQPKKMDLTLMSRCVRISRTLR